MDAVSIAPFINQATGTVIPQGAQNVGMMRLGMWTDEFTAKWTRAKVQRIGTGTDADVTSVQIFRDDNGSAAFEPALDVAISSAVAFVSNQVETDLTPTILDAATKYFFVVYDMQDSASVGKTMGVRIPQQLSSYFVDGLFASNLDFPQQESFPADSVTPLISATTDTLTLVPEFVAPGGATQGDTNVPVLKLTLNADDHTVIWRGLKLDRYNVNRVNKPGDVKETKVYYDTNGNGLLDLGTDQVVSAAPLPNEPHTFPETSLTVQASSGTTTLTVASVDGFPPPPGKLILEDNTSNRVEVTYTAINTGAKQFTITPSTNTHSAGAKVSGPMFITLQGALGGQEIFRNNGFRPKATLTAPLGTGANENISVTDTTEFPPSGTVDIESELGIAYTAKTATQLTGVTRGAPAGHPSGVLVEGPRRNKSYFVTYDISDLATVGAIVGQASELGLSLPASGYFTVGAPDLVANTNLPLTASILDINEFADTVTVTPFNMDNSLPPLRTDDTLQQKATEQLVLGFTLSTNKAEAFWSAVRINGIGTAVPETDVSLVKVWVDGDRNTFLNPENGFDVVIGTGTFGNIGQPGVASVVFMSSHVQTVVTSARASAQGIPNRYFVTFDLSPTAVPDRTLGARLADTAAFTVSAPNVMSGTNLAFSGKLRNIIPAPQQVKFEFTPVFTSLTGSATMQSLEVPRLGGSISATDTTIPITTVTTQGFPTAGYAVIDSEIIFYNSLTPTALQGVQRAQLNTAAAAHSSGTLVGLQYTQGDKNIAYMKLRASVDDPQGFQVRWFQLRVNRLLPSGLSGRDGDVALVKLYKDTGGPGLDRNPATGVVSDALIGQKKFGQSEVSGQATLQIDGSLVGGGTNYVLVDVTPADYFLVLDIDQTAVTDDVVGVRLAGPSSVIVGAQTPNDAVHTVKADNFPGSSAVTVLKPTVDTLQVKSESLMPVNITQNQKQVPVMKLNLRASANTVVWDQIRLDMTTDNNAVDGDIRLVSIYRDMDANGFFDPLVDGTTAARLTLGTEKFTARTITIDFITPEVIFSSATGQNFFITYDVDSLAQIGKRVGLSIGNTGYFTVGSPDLVQYMTGEVTDATFGTIVEVADNVKLGVDDLAADLIAAGISQGSPNVPLLKFTLQTDVAQANFERIRVERIGSSNINPFLPNGSNRDVAAIKVWNDANNDGLFSPNTDVVISVGTNTFNQVDEADRQKEIFITTNPPVVVANGAPRVFFLTYDLSNTVDATNTLGVKIVDHNSITMSFPNGMISTYADLRTGATTQAFSFEGSKVTVRPVLISITEESVAPAAASQLTANVPLLKLKMHTNLNTIVLNNLSFNQIGTIQDTGIPGRGDGDFSRAAIWRDNGDEVFVPQQDTLVGAAVHGTSAFTGGVARVPMGGFVVGTATSTFFLTVDIGQTDAGGANTVNHLAGFSLNALSQVDRLPPTSADLSTNEYPMRSGLVTILKFGLPRVPFVSVTLPKVWYDFDKDGYPDVDFNRDGKLDENEKSRNYLRDGAGEPIIDVDADGIPDNKDMNGDGRKTELDLDGDNLPDMDLDGDGLIEFDMNSDGKPDIIMSDFNGDGIPEVDLSRDGQINWGKLPEKWTNETTKLYNRWPSVAGEVTEYQVGVGERADPNDITQFNSRTFAFAANGWLSAGAKNEFTVTNLILVESLVTRTTSLPISRTQEVPFDVFVTKTEGFGDQGEIYIGSELMKYSARTVNSFRISQRGVAGTLQQDHDIGERVTNNGYFFNVRAMGEGANEGPGGPVAVYRIDLTAPSAPAAPVSDPEKNKKPAETGIYEIKWDPAADEESGVREYEIQERMDNDPVWRTVAHVPANRTSWIIGEGRVKDDDPRPRGHFFTYRVRARNFAGGWSEWSPVSAPAFTGLPPEPISQVFNYPNPADTRVGPTYITYVLNEDANVTIHLYDLLGYKVREWQFPAGSPGGKAGPNTYPWDGTNDGGAKVAAGGYILRIEVRGSKGTTTVIRKIGIIH
jgi:hypothetical protein